MGVEAHLSNRAFAASLWRLTACAYACGMLHCRFDERCRYLVPLPLHLTHLSRGCDLEELVGDAIALGENQANCVGR